jgi:hypothetical protein
MRNIYIYIHTYIERDKRDKENERDEGGQKMRINQKGERRKLNSKGPQKPKMPVHHIISKERARDDNDHHHQPDQTSFSAPRSQCSDRICPTM